jgi:acyl-CoA synthetase (AMP-forming)/AMP-acid ligase II
MIKNKKRIIIIIVIGALLIGNVYFAMNYYFTRKDLAQVEATESKAEINQKVLTFTSMFIKKVLQANTAIDFDTRLSLENSVRDLNDPAVMAEWQNFTNSKNEADAQNSVKTLLGILIDKIQR